MAPKFILVRHGEAEHNVAYHVEGESAFSNPKVKDAPLTEKGKEQSRQTGTRLADKNIIDIWCSPLTRTIQTAEELFEETSARNMYLHDSLLETLGGNHICNERKPKYEIKKSYKLWNMSFMPEMPAYWVEQEPVVSVRQRMKMFILWAMEMYKDLPSSSYILLVSHRNAIWSLTGKELENAEYLILDEGDISALAS